MSSKVRVLRSNLNSIFANLSAEEALFQKASATPTLFLWRNKPTVIVGRHQNPWKECNLKTMEDAEVVLARRYSGGGAVYQDLGCTTYTFLHKLEGSSSVSRIIDSNFDLLIRALKNIGVPAERKGRNDLIANGFKISGCAFKQTADHLIHHGTILVTTDLGHLSKYLTPSKMKLKSKGISSVAARVAKLSDFSPSVEHESVCETLTGAFRDHYGCASQSSPEILDQEIQSDPVFVSHHEKLKNWEWRYGSTPHFSHTVETRIEGVGMFECHYEVDNGRISGIKIFSDILVPDLVEELESALRGSDYEPGPLARTLNQLRDSQTTEARKTIVEEFKEWIIYEVSH
jgi:lipoate-protein ligase A